MSVLPPPRAWCRWLSPRSSSWSLIPLLHPLLPPCAGFLVPVARFLKAGVLGWGLVVLSQFLPLHKQPKTHAVFSGRAESYPEGHCSASPEHVWGSEGDLAAGNASQMGVSRDASDAEGVQSRSETRSVMGGLFLNSPKGSRGFWEVSDSQNLLRACSLYATTKTSSCLSEASWRVRTRVGFSKDGKPHPALRPVENQSAVGCLGQPARR